MGEWCTWGVGIKCISIHIGYSADTFEHIVRKLDFNCKFVFGFEKKNAHVSVYSIRCNTHGKIFVYPLDTQKMTSTIW